MHLHGRQYACDICGTEFEGNSLESHTEFPGHDRADICPHCAETREVRIYMTPEGRPTLLHWAKGTTPPGLPAGYREP
jgi:hypothetical protein